MQKLRALRLGLSAAASTRRYLPNEEFLKDVGDGGFTYPD